MKKAYTMKTHSSLKELKTVLALLILSLVFVIPCPAEDHNHDHNDVHVHAGEKALFLAEHGDFGIALDANSLELHFHLRVATMHRS